MLKSTLPFSGENKIDDHEMGLVESDLYKMLPARFQKVCRKYPYLLEYLHIVPINEVGLPEYHPRLTRKMGDDKKLNLIYPLSNGTFIHILNDSKDSRSHYIPVEPAMTYELDHVMPEVEQKCIELSDRLVNFKEDGDRRKQLLDYLDKIIKVSDEAETVSLDDKKAMLRRNGDQFRKIKVSRREMEGIKYMFLRDKIGLGVLEPLIVDSNIEDISCSGLGHVFIEHKIFKSLKSTITFSTFDELDEFVTRLAEQVKKPVTYKNPIADATLPDGSRINIVYGRDVSKRGSNFSIRKFSEKPISVFELVDFGTISYEMLAYLSLVIGNGMNVFVSGETASGKTTMLNAITTFIHPLAKIVSIEDTPELQVPHPNWIREVVQTTKMEDAGGAVTMFDLLRAALRQRPNEILVGEIRGPEGNIAFQAMQTGHSVMATFHAATVEKLIQRITSNPISVPKTYIDNLNVVVLMSTVRLPNGKTGRRVTGIQEIVAYDPIIEAYDITESFRWDEMRDAFEFSGHMTSYILEHKIAPRMGMSGSRKRRIYNEMERRTNILSKLHKEQGITDFYDVLEVLGKAQREGLF